MTETNPAALVVFIGNQRTEHRVPHRLACQVLGVSESWFYKWRERPTTAREARRGQLADAIRRIFESSGGTYGSPKVWLLLVRAGWRVSVNTVARLMAEIGLAGRKIRRRRGLARPGKRPAFPDFVRRDFTADAPDQVWCGDMTEITTGEGKLYLATVIDLFSRRLLGYAMGSHHDAELVLASLNMAAATRGGDVKGVLDVEIVHREPGTKGFTPQPKRWAIEQTLGTLMPHRRLVRDFETRPSSSAAWIHWSMTDLMLRRLTRSTAATWRAPHAQHPASPTRRSPGEASPGQDRGPAAAATRDGRTVA
ncbi:IS3 family transposase [Streptomyces sp. A1-5]|uniref:IS3 family transposase n=1 Tax=Streptomyces sp. A1-5 TaxID=2738410 RepID=UPI001F48934C|nr:IS3 family transposase [Streptomyces sp. A1-5]